MTNEPRSQADIEIDFPLVNFGGHAKGDPKAKAAMFDLTHEAYSPFNGCQNWQVFIFCCTYGFANKKIRKNPPGQGTLPTTAFKSDTRDIMRAIAIAETKDLKIIKKASGKDGYVRICEEYAYSSLSEVYNRIRTKDDGKEKSGEDVLNKMIKEIDNTRT
jgi:hypothetical protein